MRTFIHFALTVLIFSIRALSADISSTSGTVYSNIEVRRVEPDGISIKHSAGIVKLFVKELPPDVLEKYGLDEETARTYQSERETALAVRNAQMLKNLDQQNAEWKKQESIREAKEENRRIAQAEHAIADPIKIRILSVMEDGLLGHKYISVMVPSGQFHKRVLRISDHLVFVYCNSSVYYDGIDWSGMVVPHGTYNYLSAAGASRTVKAYKRVGQ